MREQHNLCPTRAEIAKGCERGAQPGVVRDVSVFHRGVEIHPDQRAFAGQLVGLIERAEGHESIGGGANNPPPIPSAASVASIERGPDVSRPTRARMASMVSGMTMA